MTETVDISPQQSASVSDLPRLSYGFAREHGVLLIEQDGVPVILTREAATLKARLEARRIADRPVPVQPVSLSEFETQLAKIYAHGDLAETAETALEGPDDLTFLADNLPQTSDLLGSDDDAPVIRLINGIIQQAIKCAPQIYILSRLKIACQFAFALTAPCAMFCHCRRACHQF